MRAFDADPSIRWLFCLTHPDDELAMGAWIRRLSSAGAEVWLSWTHDTDTRRREARSAAKLLGVPEARHIFHGAADGGIVDSLFDLRPQFDKMFQLVRPDRVCTTAFEQGHLDHDATNLLVNAGFDGPVFEFPMYHTYLTRFQRLNRFADPDGEEILELDHSEQQFKIALARQYPSQTIWRNVLWYEALHKMIGRPSRLCDTERLRLQTHCDYLIPNLPSPLKERVLLSKSWQRWARAAAPFLSEVEFAKRAVQSR